MAHREPSEIGVPRAKGGRRARLKQRGGRVNLYVSANKVFVWDTIREMAQRHGVTLSSFVEGVLEDYARWKTYMEQKTAGGGYDLGKGKGAKKLARGIYSHAVSDRTPVEEIKGGFSTSRSGRKR